MPLARPHSFMEWVIGANVVPRTASQRRIATLDWTTDDDTGDDTVHLTLPRDKLTKRDKRVRFTEQVAKEKAPDNTVKQTKSSGATEVSGDKSTTKSDSAVEDIDSDCPCMPCVSGRKKLEEEKQASKTNAEPPKPESDADIHAKHKEKKLQAKAKPDGKSSGQTNNQGKKKAEQAPGTSEESEKASGDKGKQESKPNKKNGKGANKKQPELIEEESSSEDTEDEPPKAKSKKKDKKQAGSTKSNASEHHKKKKDTGAVNKEKREKKGAATPSAHLLPRRPDLLMPVQARVLQVEHSIEGAEDPRPNAFYDSEHGVMRVYHGPVYGNVYGALYPKRASGTLPVGTPHPAQNPFLYGFAPPGFHIPPAAAGAVPPPGPDGPSQNPWFQSWGTTTVPGVPPKTPANPRDTYNESPSLRANAKKDNNVVPFQPASTNSRGSRKADSSKPADVQNDKGFDSKEQSSGDKDGVNDNTWKPADSNKIDESLEKMRASNNGSKKNTPQVTSNHGSKQGSKQPSPSKGSPSQKSPSTAGNVGPIDEGSSTVNQGSPSLKPPSTAGNIGPSNSGGGGGDTAADISGSKDPNSNQRHHRRTPTNEVCPPGSWPPHKQKESTDGNAAGGNWGGKQNDDPVAAPAGDTYWRDPGAANTTDYWDTTMGLQDLKCKPNW